MNPVDPQFEALLIYLKESRGFDFTGYKRSSLMRRVNRRMTQLALTDYGDYVDHLQVHPDEFTTLFNTILINVTGFFRDPEAWESLRTEVLGPLVDAKPAETPIRVWSAGCASGEEAYTIAILLAEVLGPDEFRKRVKIYATDVDEEGLAEARQATYSERDLGAIPPGLLERYFEVSGSRYAFRKDLRRSVIFGRNDLVRDAPIGRIDLLVCRNTLMYLNAETQSRIVARFHFALADGGILFLGKAEMLLSRGGLFLPVDLKQRVFRMVPRPALPNGLSYPDGPPQAAREPLTALDLLRSQALNASPVAQLVVTTDGLVALANRQVETLFDVSSRDIGRPFRDLELSYRPVELLRYVEQVQLDRRAHRLTDVEFHPASGEALRLDVQLNPLIDGDATLLGVALVFQDVTDGHRLKHELQHANQQLERAYEELQSTNEELETTNEELHSTVEELETTNEELQSTNEELETTNEELQSTNEELETTNARLRQSYAELDGANAFLDAILTSLRAGVTVIDRDLRVLVWNRRAEDLWGLRRADVLGRHLLKLDIGLPTDRLRPMIRRVLTGTDHAEELALRAVNRRGRPVAVRVTCSALTVDGAPPSGAIMLVEVDGDIPATAPATVPAAEGG